MCRAIRSPSKDWSGLHKMHKENYWKISKKLIAMQSILDVEVSGFSSYASVQPKTLNLLTWLRSDKYADRIAALRQETDKSKRDRIKASLPAITVSGVFDPLRKEENLLRHSGLICIDIDHSGNTHIANFAELKEQLFHIENVAYAGASASGNGFFLIIPIRSPARHKAHFQAIKGDLERYGLVIDPAPQNVASLRGYSYDPEALFRHDAKPYLKWKKEEGAAEKKKRARAPFKRDNQAEGTKARVERLVQSIVDRRIDITQSEPDWFRLACAFANEFGEEGRGYFRAISQFHPEYDPGETDRKFDHALKGRYGRIGIGTFLERSSLVYC